jgi:glycosyltransferase involved in cell wall biosynthesis
LADTRPRCSIIVRCLNEERHIGKLLEGVMRQTVRDIEIIVVDSGSTDETLKVASHFPVRILHIDPREFSFGRSLNRGIAAATSDVTVAISAHCYPVYVDWLERLLEPFADPEVAVVYGRQRGGETTHFSETQIFAKWFPADPTDSRTNPFSNNANCAIRRSLWEKHPYDEELPGLEDIDWAKRVQGMGFRVVYRPEAEIIHVHEETQRGIFRRYEREGIAMGRIYPETRLSFFGMVGLLVSNVMSDYLHAMHEGVLLRNAFSVPSFRFAQFTGTWAGLRKRGQLSADLRRRLYYPRRFRPATPSSAGEQRPGAIEYLLPRK